MSDLTVTVGQFLNELTGVVDSAAQQSSSPAPINTTLFRANATSFVLNVIAPSWEQDLGCLHHFRELLPEIH